MKRFITAAVLVLCIMAGATAQQQYPEDQFPAQLPVKKDAQPPHIDNTPPHSPESAGESSSKSTKIDLSPPEWEQGRAPKSTTEKYSYNPQRAAKATEVGTFYFKKGSYKAALSRFQEALQWKPNDAEATFKLAQTFEKLGQPSEARANYQAYLKILPDGPHAKDAQKALEKLSKTAVSKEN